MRHLIIFLSAALFMGCATTTTTEDRRRAELDELLAIEVGVDELCPQRAESSSLVLERSRQLTGASPRPSLSLSDRLEASARPSFRAGLGSTASEDQPLVPDEHGVVHVDFTEP